MSEFYSQVKNPVWANAEHTRIDCEVDFGHLDDEFVPFTANPTDKMEYSKTIFNECVAGKYGEIAPYVPYVSTAKDNKQKATQLLQETDWVNQPDVINTSLTPHLLNHADFIAYRSSLRTIAVNPVAGEIVFPTKPQEQWSS